MILFSNYKSIIHLISIISILFVVLPSTINIVCQIDYDDLYNRNVVKIPVNAKFNETGFAGFEFPETNITETKDNLGLVPVKPDVAGRDVIVDITTPLEPIDPDESASWARTDSAAIRAVARPSIILVTILSICTFFI